MLLANSTSGRNPCSSSASVLRASVTAPPCIRHFQKRADIVTDRTSWRV